MGRVLCRWSFKSVGKHFAGETRLSRNASVETNASAEPRRYIIALITKIDGNKDLSLSIFFPLSCLLLLSNLPITLELL